MYLIIFLFCFIHINAVTREDFIYHLNESEYARMPPKFHLDRYEPCIELENGEYCIVNFDLVHDFSKHSIETYDLIKNYSKVETNFNLLKPRYGICITKTCKKFYKRNVSEDRSVILEACLNESLWEEYALRAKVSSDVTCHTKHTKVDFDVYDAIVAAILLSILSLNVVGSLQISKTKGNTILQYFSISRNWQDLTAPDKQQNQLKGLDALRTVGATSVIFLHALLQYGFLIDNSRFMDEQYSNIFFWILLLYMTHVVQIFFIISGLLRAYNMLVDEEKRQATWDVLPKAIFTRWLRLSPPYFAILAITATLLRHAGSGPVWQEQWDSKIEYCRQYWWLNALYTNNYDDHVLNYNEFKIAPKCMLQTWSIAADFHLHVVGVVCMMLAASKRKLVLSMLLVAGVLLPAAHTYFQDLEPFVIMSSKFVEDGGISNLTFRHTYRKSHNNLSSYVIGLILGIIIYRWQKKQYHFSNYWNQRFLKRLTWLSFLLFILWGSYFLQNCFNVPIMYKVLFAGLSRILFGSAVAFLIIGLVVTGLYRTVLESNFWRIPSRVSYSVYLIHFVIIRLLAGTRTHLMHISILHMVELGISSVVASFLAAIIFYLIIEGPFQNLVKHFSRNPHKEITVDNKHKEYGKHF